MPQSTLDTKIAVLEKSVQSMKDLFSRLDLAIERIGEVSNSINQLLAVHEQKIAQTQEDTGDLFKLVEKRRVEVDAGARELHSRISSQHREIKEEIREDYKRLEGHIGEIKELLTGTKAQTDHNIEQIEARLRNMEKKQWIIIGAASLAGVILGNLNVVQSIF
jgi:septation ring formation regulator EzrA